MDVYVIVYAVVACAASARICKWFLFVAPVPPLACLLNRACIVHDTHGVRARTVLLLVGGRKLERHLPVLVASLVVAGARAARGCARVVRASCVARAVALSAA